MTVDELAVDARGLLQQLGEALIVTDLERRIAFWNDAARRMYGWGAEEALGQNIDELLHPEPQRGGDRKTVDEFLDAHNEWRGQVVHHDRSGQRLVVASTVRRLLDDGKPVGRIVSNRRVTQRAALEQRVRLENLESVAFIASGIAHDVKNMLSGAMGLAELIVRRMADHPGANLARQMKQSLREAAALTAQMATYRNKEDLGLEAFDANERLRGLIDLLSGMLPETHELVFDPSSELPIRMAEGHLEQVVTNLVLNARDAMADGGRIHVTTHLISDDSDPPIDHAVVTVSDEGAGMTSEIQAEIFEPYFTTKPVGLGTGLGLPTSRDVVRRYHGSIEVESSPGGGARFTVRIPLAPEAQSAMKSG